MKTTYLATNLWARVIILALLAALSLPGAARADVAPPESPPGSGIAPAEDTTQVAMISEQVTLDIIPNQADNEDVRAKTTATFLMRNQGASAESMDVRFPLTFGSAAYYTDAFPEISDIQVNVDGKTISTKRTISKDENSDKNIPWANFPVTFSPGKDVIITVTYTTLGFGYDPFIAFKYILETGAGWNGSIGSGDITVNFPYPANNQNVLLDETTGYSMTFGTPTFDGNAARWHFDNFEPQPGQNFEISLVKPSYWKKILSERQNISKNPNDGEAQGRLGKAIKEVIRYPKGYLRTDDGGRQLYAEAVTAYEQSVTFLPKDALWHYGYADLLWSHYEFDVFYAGSQNVPELVSLVDQLDKSLQLDPNSENTRNLADWISNELPGVIQKTDQGYVFLALTATPTTAPAVPTVTPELEFTFTPIPPPPPSPTPIVAQPAGETQPAPAPTPATAQNPLCGGAALILPLLAGLASVVSKRR
jgi:hypothetical protein